MLTEHSRSWTHQWKMEGLAEGRKEGHKEGLEEGREEGRQEGLKEGQASILHGLLTRKFGALPDSVQQRLENAAPEDLQAWALTLLDARTLDDVFGDN
ncbi:DUF4351 domain-containing protein [Pusillimonas sp.]|uniref:DUF4351 domain-containing protein n=1 Tax=Pusillimonas sp. TaxID=3040095 RepID=UPI0029A142E7|nr:DUF4351 domain-containing protein [Pusillimonas sp.]MDX3895159.1 DUF4351 domain-containing protein [Pusillimonas sp.]